MFFAVGKTVIISGTGQKPAQLFAGRLVADIAGGGNDFPIPHGFRTAVKSLGNIFCVSVKFCIDFLSAVGREMKIINGIIGKHLSDVQCF